MDAILYYYCADSTSIKYAARPPNGVAAPWLCTASAPGCLDSTAANFQSWATEHRASLCYFAGCNDTAARNFEATVSQTHHAAAISGGVRGGNGTRGVKV